MCFRGGVLVSKPPDVPGYPAKIFALADDFRHHARMRANRTKNQLRIIGGRWRGRKLPFAPLPGLRPTPDRVRETLFNWLSPVMAGSRCLDLYAGSGALGLEAASRGASRVVMVDRSARVAQILLEQVEILHADAVEVVQAEVQSWLRGPARQFDIVFLDPPFRQALVSECLALLEAKDWLAPDAYIYIEAERDLPLRLPQGWSLYRSKQAGQVGYHLARRQPD